MRNRFVVTRQIFLTDTDFPLMKTEAINPFIAVFFKFRKVSQNLPPVVNRCPYFSLFRLRNLRTSFAFSL